MLLNRIISSLYPASFLLLNNSNETVPYQTLGPINIQYIIQLLCHHSICQHVIFINITTGKYIVDSNKLHTLTINHNNYYDSTTPQSNSPTDRTQYLSRRDINNVDQLLKLITDKITHLNSNTTFNTTTKSQERETDDDNNITQTTIPIIIDSLIPLLLRHSIESVATFLSSLKQLPNTILISTYSNYCIHKNQLQHATNILQHCATTYIQCNTLHIPIVNTDNIVHSIDLVLDIVHRRKSGRVAVAMEHMQYNMNNNNITSKSIERISHTTNKHKVDIDTKRLQAAGTMNMSLTNKQQQQRNNTVLPYIQTHINTSGLFSVTGVHKQTLEQYDREDPDEALDEDNEEPSDSSDSDQDTDLRV